LGNQIIQLKQSKDKAERYSSRTNIEGTATPSGLEGGFSTDNQ